MKHFMLDLETMDTRPSAAMVAIGCVEMDLINCTLGEHFYMPIDLSSAMETGGTVDGDTIMWWMGQEQAARDALKNGAPIKDVLSLFEQYVQEVSKGDKRVVRMWGNGADFDNVILGNSYRRMGHYPPWTYNHNRCYRTIKVGHPEVIPDVTVKRVGTAHNALDDAVFQANMLFKMIGGKDYP